MIATIVAFFSSGFMGKSPSLISNPLKVDIEMGRGPHCTGKEGICNVTTNTNNTKKTSADFSSDLHIDAQGHLIMRIVRNEISSDLFEDQFQNKELILRDEFELPAALLDEMKVSHKNLVILKGRYPIEITKTEIIITFDLQSR